VVLPLNKNGQLTENALALKEVCESKGIKVFPIGLRLQDVDAITDVEYLMRITSPQVPMLLEDAMEAIISNSEKITIDRLEKFLNKRLKDNSELAKPLATIKSKKGVSYYISTFDAALRALRSLKDFFDHDTKSLQLDEHPMSCFKAQGTTILYLDDLGHDAKIMWEMQLLRWLNSNKKDLSDTFVFFDEAHQIIPAHPIGVSSKETFDRLRANFEQLARDGRKYRVNLVLSTQSPKDVHEIVPDQCPNRVVMKINPRNAAHAYLDPELAMIANKFSAGEFWFQSPFNGTPNWLRIHGIANPIPHEPMDKFWDKIRAAAEQTKTKPGKK
jgi:hypothetical protein